MELVATCDAPKFRSIQILPAEVTVPAVFLTKQTSIPYGQTLVPVGGDQKIVLEAGDYLQVQSSTASSIDVIVSLLEIT